MESISNDIQLEVYQSLDNYIGKVYISNDLVKQNISHSKLGTIVVLDRSGSMGSTFFKLMNRILPNIFRKLGYHEDSPVISLVTFESKVEVHETTVGGFSKLKLSSQGETYMAPAMYQVEDIMTNWIAYHHNNYRILAISDGELNDQNETVIAAEKVKAVIKKNKFNVNSHAIRFFTSNDEPDTRGLSSIMQYNTITSPSLKDVTIGMSEEEIVDIIYPLFANDGFDTKIVLKNSLKEKLFKKEPWSEGEAKIQLFPGENIFWINKDINDKIDKNKLIVKMINHKEANVKIIKKESLSFDNYQKIINPKIDFYIQKMKILKILNTQDALDEMENIINFFSKFENSLSANSTENQLLDKKIGSRVQQIRNIIAKRTNTLQNKLNSIKNDENINNLNSKQQAEYLRSLEIKDKTGKSLARRAKKEGIDFDEIAKEEVIQISKHIDELKDIDDSSHTISFYSTCTTLDGLRTLAQMPNEPELFDSLTVNDILKLINIVGIAANGKIANYPDPMVYRLNKIYVGTFVSMSDIITSLEVGNGKTLTEIGNTNNEINTCIPYFDDERIHLFLLKYAPKILEYTASIGMRRIIAEVPYTWEYTYLAGIWKMIQLLIKERTEINIKTFVNLIHSYQNASNGHFDYVLNLIKKQKEVDPEKLSIFIAYNNMNNMTSPLLTMIKNSKGLEDENMIKRVLRATYQHEIYQYVRGLLKKHIGDEQNKFISTFLKELLGIDYEKHQTPLPKMFEENKNPNFYDEYKVNDAKLDDFLKQVYYADYISLVPKYFFAALSKNPVEEFKNLPELGDNLDKLIAESLGIDYDIRKFKLFCVVQSFIQKTKNERCDTDNKKMKIVDLGYHNYGNKMVKTYVKSCYSIHYALRLQKQTREGQRLLMLELIEQLTTIDNKEKFLQLLDKGIIKGNLIYTIDDISSRGFIELKAKLIDKNANVPLRGFKLICIATGHDDKGNVVWNKGNVLRSIDDIGTIKELIPEEWKYIQGKFKQMNKHIYRLIENRHGHSNAKASFWAMGFDSIEEMFKMLSKEEVEKYKEIHKNCCGLNIINKCLSFKQIKRKQQKEFRQKREYNKSNRGNRGKYKYYK